MKLLAKLVDGISKNLLDMIVEFTPTVTLIVGQGQQLLSMLDASDAVPHKHVCLVIMRSMIYH